MKIVAYVLGLLVLGLTVGYLYVSQPIPTIANAVNPDGVHNLHLIDEDPLTGFAIYRLGQPDADDVRGMCALGIEEIAVLAGSALEHEAAYQSECPSLTVIYNVEDTLASLSGLQQQIVALHEYINGQPCGQGEYCLVQSSPQPPFADFRSARPNTRSTRT